MKDRQISPTKLTLDEYNQESPAVFVEQYKSRGNAAKANKARFAPIIQVQEIVVPEQRLPEKPFKMNRPI